MQWLWQKIGILAFWLAWPALTVYLRWRRERTRIIITHGPQIVVLKTWLGTGKWGLPGGGLHKHEEPLDGVLREAAEETGVRLDARQVTFLAAVEYREHGLRFHCHYFMAELSKAVPLRAQLWEISELAWLDRAALDAKNAAPDVRTALRHLTTKMPRE